mmetsp:Transcript_34580/g.90230  ORF Transcript_34580/g.90230 Transcript_34580/m.90230 type:complete len:156 (-) Transcript_34580:153-620(-)
MAGWNRGFDSVGNLLWEQRVRKERGVVSGMHVAPPHPSLISSPDMPLNHRAGELPKAAPPWQQTTSMSARRSQRTRSNFQQTGQSMLWDISVPVDQATLLNMKHDVKLSFTPEEVGAHWIPGKGKYTRFVPKFTHLRKDLLNRGTSEPTLRSIRE